MADDSMETPAITLPPVELPPVSTSTRTDLPTIVVPTSIPTSLPATIIPLPTSTPITETPTITASATEPYFPEVTSGLTAMSTSDPVQPLETTTPTVLTTPSIAAVTITEYIPESTSEAQLFTPTTTSTSTPTASKIATLLPGSPSPEPTVTSDLPAALAEIRGQVVHPGSYSVGTTIVISSGSVVVWRTITAGASEFSAKDLNPGQYRVQAYQSGYLPVEAFVRLSAGQILSLPLVHLVAGDINGDGIIDVRDFDLLFQSYGDYHTSVQSIADFNSDGRVDLLDLRLLAENLHRVGPILWE